MTKEYDVYHSTSVRFYDLLYAAQGKDYRKETDYLVKTIRSNGGERARSLLDVACGSGAHLSHLRKHFDVEGVDISAEFLSVAQAKSPAVKFHLGDMRTFRTGKLYDVVTCLFSSIGYMVTVVELDTAIANMAAHLAPGGLLLVEPWFPPGFLESGRVAMLVVEDADMKLVRMNTMKVDGAISSFDFHYLIGTPSGTEHVVETHRMGLFSEDQMLHAFAASSLSVHYIEEGLTGRGLYAATAGT